VKAFAQFISYLFHPIWMPLYVVLIFWEMDTRIHILTQNSAWIYITMVVVINSIIIPTLMFWMMKSLGVISSLTMEDKKDRVFPFLVTGLFYLTSWFVFYNLGILDLVAYLFIVATALVIVALIVNLFWKISVHSMSMGALSVFILYLTTIHFIPNNWPAYIIIFLSGLVGFARLKLKSHNATQVYVGYLSGIIITALFLIGLG
jgi:membrane-associated phospholipid phosphatase